MLLRRFDKEREVFLSSLNRPFGGIRKCVVLVPVLERNNKHEEISQSRKLKLLSNFACLAENVLKCLLKVLCIFDQHVPFSLPLWAKKKETKHERNVKWFISKSWATQELSPFFCTFRDSQKEQEELWSRGFHDIKIGLGLGWEEQFCAEVQNFNKIINLKTLINTNSTP